MSSKRRLISSSIGVCVTLYRHGEVISARFGQADKATHMNGNKCSYLIIDTTRRVIRTGYCIRNVG